jgi:hypothetical protein
MGVEVGDPVTAEEARELACDECGAAAGTPCAYMADGSRLEDGVRVLCHLRGDPMAGVHARRRAAVRRRRASGE